MLNLWVGLAMGLSLLSAAAVWVNFQWRNDRQILLRSHTQQDTRALMDTLVHDLKRANFQGHFGANGSLDIGSCPSDFCGAVEDFQFSAHQILFSIDRNDNGMKDNNECSGFRLNAKELQTKTSCQPAVWTSLSDSKNLQVLELNFRFQCNNSALHQGHSLLISIRSQSSSEKVPSTWQRVVRLRNNTGQTGNLQPDCTDTSA
jgi:Tfp pilus assembly protein PilW